MLQEVLNQLKEEYGFGPLVLKERGWFLLETNPLPPQDELLPVITDICFGRLVRIKDGKIYHSPSCSISNHVLPSKHKKFVVNALKNLREQRFLIAIHKGDPLVHGGQPVAVALEPSITYNKYPDHPHLSIRGAHSLPTAYLSDSLCYTDPYSLSNDIYERFKEALAQVCIWLLRHQVWEATKSVSKQGVWIGAGTEPLAGEHFATLLNPLGQCRCGKDEKYINCHLTKHISFWEKCSLEEAKNKVQAYALSWPLRVNVPQTKELEFLKQLLIN